ncbi:hypothetical protein PHLCEN_2v1428 [Hermanssonia centrifuga]|uniref:Uncharacterized protein n=1 Tax=Hermanssonia centrifuga TaxID=98765 RepID=A0A2R6RZZ6_9APHY|nr:hypothetical protein PHLCEN_2v1428 [Hermanssonia centrifuga]
MLLNVLRRSGTSKKCGSGFGAFVGSDDFSSNGKLDHAWKTWEGILYTRWKTNGCVIKHRHMRSL